MNSKIIQKQIDRANTFATITLPEGTLDLTDLGEDGLVLNGKEWLTLKGHENGTLLINNTLKGRVLTIRNSAHCRISGPFGVDAPIDGTGVCLEWDGLSNYNTLGNKISDLRIRGGRYGIEIGTDYYQSTSENRIIDCQISDQSEASICVATINGQNNWLIGGYTIGAPIGILVKSGTIHTAIGTCSVIHSECVIKYLNTPTTATSFHGHYVEQSPKFIDIPGPTGQRSPITLIGCLLYCGKEWGETTDVIVNRGVGPLTIIGGEIGIKGSPCRIVVEAGAHSPVAVIGVAFWDNKMGNFLTNSQTGGFNIQSCINMYSNDALWATPLARPFFANENGVDIACLSNTQKLIPRTTLTPFSISVYEWFVASPAPWGRGAYTIGHPFTFDGGYTWWPQT